MAKMIDPDHAYVNFDHSEHRRIFVERSWDRKKSLLIFDELHKMRSWKRWLKGIYDVEGLNPPIVVTGSARLETYRKVGDSLAGRYFPFRLHPLDLKELAHVGGEEFDEDPLDRLLRVGGFPEPFLEGTRAFYERWRRTHLDIILRQDLIDLENIRQIVQVETLIEFLRSRVGSPISYSSLARDLGTSDKTIKRWLTLLENMYVLFKIVPFHRNIARSLLKTPKYYFYDTGQILGDDGVKFENVVANALLKEIHFRADCLGEIWNLHYLRTKGGKEVDFALVREGKIHWIIEVKLADAALAPTLRYYASRLPEVRGIQLVKDISREKTFTPNLEIRQATTWLRDMAF